MRSTLAAFILLASALAGAFLPHAGLFAYRAAEARPLAEQTRAATGLAVWSQSGGIAVALGEWSDLIRQAAAESGVPWQVIAAIILIESGGDPDMRSSAGAIGLMQIRPGTWPEADGMFGPDLWDPWTNIRTGAGILAGAYAAWGTWEQAAAAYVGALDAEGNVTDRLDEERRTGRQYVLIFQRQLNSLGYIIAPVASAYSRVATDVAVVQIAATALGTPYVWGGESYEEGGFDCSGLTLWAYAQVGVALPRTAQQQWNATRRIPPEDAQPGDLIFFANTYTPESNADTRARITSTDREVITHVGIYAGNGMMLHAPKENDYVRLVALVNPYWLAHLAGYGSVR